MATKRKKTAAIAAGVLSAALLLGGTFAWMSMDQEAKNESAGVVNVGGRLHDDYDGYNRLNESSNTYSLSVVDTQNGAVANKDIYVENFTDAKTGGYPIYARVRMSEYMEVGPEAGAYTTTEGISTFDAGRKAVSVVPGAVIDDKSTWAVHKPSTEVELCETECTCGVDDCKGALHSHWTWTMGNENPVAYMPTFDRDKDSIAADVNGSWRGLDAEDMVYFDDYVLYTTDEQAGLKVDATTNTATDAEGNPLTDENGNVIDFTGVEVLTAVDGPVYSVKDYAYYDDDTNGEPNGHGDPLYGATSEVETHFAQNTGTAEVITMEEWLSQDGKNKAAGDYWVYDGDGWAYWANPIMPGQATGLLLDSIEMTLNPGEKSYYAIHVEAEFATVGDWSHFTGFDAEGENANAAELLKAASENVTHVTITQGDGFNSVHPGGELQFEASTVKGLAMGLSEEDFEWFICDAEGKEYTGKSTIEAGLLKVAEDEAEGTVLLVGAESVAVPGAVGLRSVTVRTPEVELEIKGSLPLKEGKVPMYNEGIAYQETLELVASGANAAEDASVTWSLETVDGSNISITSDPSNQFNADLTIKDGVKLGEVVVKAEYALPSGYKKEARYTVIKNPEIATSDELGAECQYAILTDDGSGNGTYAMYLIRSNSEIIPGTSTYGGKPILAKALWEADRFYFSEDTTANASYKAKVSSVETVNTMQVSTVDHAFGEFSALKSVNLRKLDVSTLSSFSQVFMKCEALETLDLSYLDFSEKDAISARHLVSYCPNLKSVKLPEKLKASEMASLFDSCSSLTEIENLDTWDVSECTTFGGAFYGCTALTSLPVEVENWDTSSVENMSQMFYKCPNLVLNCSNWNVKNVTNRTYFAGDAPGVTLPLDWQTAESN